MSSLKKSEEDLTSLPKKVKDYSEKEVTLGDMHGNSLRLFYSLVKCGIIKCSSDDYDSFKDIYNQFDTDVITNNAKELCLKAESILKKCKVNNTVFLRLIGDLIADRGNNDYLTFLILKLLNDNNVNYEILFSNHDLYLVDFLERCKNKEFNFSKHDYIKYIAQSGLPVFQQFKSSAYLFDSIDFESFKKIYDKIYKSKLKLLSYNFQKNVIILFSHAPTSFSEIKNIAKKDNTEISRPEGYAKLIDKINSNFKNILYSKNIKDKISFGTNIHNFVWNRNFNQNSNSENGVEFLNVHGHVGSNSSKFKHYKNLDTFLGKCPSASKGSLKIVTLPLSKKFIKENKNDNFEKKPQNNLNSQPQKKERKIYLKALSTISGFFAGRLLSRLGKSIVKIVSKKSTLKKEANSYIKEGIFGLLKTSVAVYGFNQLFFHHDDKFSKAAATVAIADDLSGFSKKIFFNKKNKA